MARSKKRGQADSKLGIVLISVVLVLFAVVMFGQSQKTRTEIEELKRTEADYKEKLQDELDRADELEERRIYVQTKMYVEEMAKKLGLVYPDEIIYKPFNID